MNGLTTEDTEAQRNIATPLLCASVPSVVKKRISLIWYHFRTLRSEWAGSSILLEFRWQLRTEKAQRHVFAWLRYLKSNFGLVCRKRAIGQTVLLSATNVGKTSNSTARRIRCFTYIRCCSFLRVSAMRQISGKCFSVFLLYIRVCPCSSVAYIRFRLCRGGI
ncbi:hypothetical protein PDESU_06386 [Pontiella desulfatans]|uniref:Uncharacterized protein n=1 Tax=Pontiella desulfatans TaxID=2750659 RepID=A0A6C2UEI8_PONDE|nr:hypothetical protein PDESU_06386 [Pontiella desulfatans]